MLTVRGPGTMSCLQSYHGLGKSGAEVVEGWRSESRDSRRSDMGPKIGAERVLRRDNSGFWGGVEGVEVLDTLIPTKFPLPPHSAAHHGWVA